MCSHRTALTIVIFIARASIAAGFQVSFVYTPEVRQYFSFFKVVFSFLDSLPLTKSAFLLPIGFSNSKQGLSHGNL